MIRNPVGCAFSQQALDVAVCTPIPGVAGVAMEKVVRAKEKKYLNHCTSNGFGFTPLVVESTGMLHDGFLRFLRNLANSASEVRRIPEAILVQYFVRRISICLVHSIAKAIDGRYSKLNSHSDIDLDLGFSAEVIMGM